MSENINEKVNEVVEEVRELDVEEMDEVAGGFKKPKAKKGYSIYKIQHGDTLIRIAEHHGCTYKDLMRWNPKITNPRLIRTGDYLYIKK